jgi:hypothetical protein
MADSLQIFPGESLLPDYQELYTRVYLQVKKDFHPYVEITSAPEHLSAEWLLDEIRRMLASVIERQPLSLGSIVYRIDLSEKLVRNVMQSSTSRDRLDEISALVLRREAQKVWLRHTLK